ncbi:glutamate N-acetyltransferase [Candidatus Electrothrix marina]|uniref:Arginine biosynthesis bifunctional protein ArgJ n=2 Tax=Candidatus Electrothrix marina TaxID=1859130 RepID=A0A3S3QKL7_9BACT|nr:glutamate N-acetyltransferase [Candidatus Electrothrix marina]RWX49903.1 glutamate N-acetyltransferase [Candidatus Electrothrix marina]
MKVKGFTAAAVRAGIRYQDRLDLGLIYSEVPAVTVGMFTTNTVQAAPVVLGRKRLLNGKAQAVLVNSGNANACSGEQGMEAALRTGSLVADALGIDEELVQVASTGVIGEPVNIEPFVRAVPGLAASLKEDGFDDLAQAIMTTDTVPKTSFATVEINGVSVNLLGVAKGAGMIMPDMATMLCFVVTDARIPFSTLNEIVKTGVEQSFNLITVDGDTSTNDTVLVMANGAAKNPWIDEENQESTRVFTEALHKIFKDLALQIVSDGEGTTKVVTIRVVGARSREDAMNGARTIANSALVKTAFFGEDANWGRIIAALGRSGCQFQPDRVSIAFDDAVMVENGLGCGKEAEEKASKVLRQKEFTVTVDLLDGSERAEVFTTDLTCDYVNINADYRS